MSGKVLLCRVGKFDERKRPEYWVIAEFLYLALQNIDMVINDRAWNTVFKNNSGHGILLQPCASQLSLRTD
jgi:hypothetical protein